MNTAPDIASRPSRFPLSRWHRTRWLILTVVSTGLLAATLLHWAPLSLTEVFGFISGAVCVLLVVQENIWNFPVGIANNLFFIALFLSSRLYGDMALQIVYIALGAAGWYQWLRGGENRTHLHVTRTSLREAASLIGIGAVATAGMYVYFRRINDAAPFLDALTTVLSLVAQYLLNGKRIESWYIWICADVLYIGLYFQRGLYLTAILYALFIGLCIAGLRAWSAAMRHPKGGTPLP